MLVTTYNYKFFLFTRYRNYVTQFKSETMCLGFNLIKTIA